MEKLARKEALDRHIKKVVRAAFKRRNREERWSMEAHNGSDEDDAPPHRQTDLVDRGTSPGHIDLVDRGTSPVGFPEQAQAGQPQHIPLTWQPMEFNGARVWVLSAPMTGLPQDPRAGSRQGQDGPRGLFPGAQNIRHPPPAQVVRPPQPVALLVPPVPPVPPAAPRAAALPRAPAAALPRAPAAALPRAPAAALPRAPAAALPRAPAAALPRAPAAALPRAPAAALPRAPAAAAPRHPLPPGQPPGPPAQPRVHRPRGRPRGPRSPVRRYLPPRCRPGCNCCCCGCGQGGCAWDCECHRAMEPPSPRVNGPCHPDCRCCCCGCSQGRCDCICHRRVQALWPRVPQLFGRARSRSPTPSTARSSGRSRSRSPVMGRSPSPPASPPARPRRRRRIRSRSPLVARDRSVSPAPVRARVPLFDMFRPQAIVVDPAWLAGSTPFPPVDRIPTLLRRLGFDFLPVVPASFDPQQGPRRSLRIQRR